MHEPPQFIAESKLLRSAYEMADAAHHGPPREGETEIDHPVAVAELLHQNGFEDHVVAAALLHDVVEDTSLNLQTIAESFGQDIARLVSEMTEDARIEPYERRKAEHRARVSQDRRAAAIYAADKLATTRGLEGAEDVPPEKLQHYLRTLETLCETNPELPFLPELREELTRLVERPS
jgi:GTP diphosphokinase / guanosine-3',5'-bis(diphosphate) 3'-diphosphatase